MVVIVDEGAKLEPSTAAWYMAASHKVKVAAKNISRIALLAEETTKYIVQDSKLTKEQITFGLPTMDVRDTVLSEQCPLEVDFPCQPRKYRAYNGYCNNVQNPRWGNANTRYLRFLPPDYSDGNFYHHHHHSHRISRRHRSSSPISFSPTIYYPLGVLHFRLLPPPSRALFHLFDQLASFMAACHHCKYTRTYLHKLYTFIYLYVYGVHSDHHMDKTVFLFFSSFYLSFAVSVSLPLSRSLAHSLTRSALQIVPKESSLPQSQVGDDDDDDDDGETNE